MEKNLTEQYARWRREAAADPDLQAELAAMEGDAAKIEDAFYRELSFGTAGIRGVLGAGTNRMNVYVVARATKGLANYLKKHFEGEALRVAIGFDSRIKSDVFVRTAAAVLAGEGIRVFLWPELMPVPCVSFATRYLGCCAGIMVTASHNPAEYNGYKAYGGDGCQLGEDEAACVLAEIGRLDLFDDFGTPDFEAGLRSGLISYIGEDVFTAYVETVKTQSLLGRPGMKPAEVDKDVAIVYTPLNGAGLRPVLRVLRETGFTNVTVVAEQEKPDGHFPTCPYPNPEIREAMALGMEYARRADADLLMATDPDSDRIGIAVKDGDDYRLITGNQTGVLLCEYICTRRLSLAKMPWPAYIVKSIVTTGLADKVAAGYGVRTLNVLTGFKYIGEQIARLEEGGTPDAFLLGFEESYGYLAGTHARDKDAVVAAMLIAEMFAYYRTRGISLLDKLGEIYAKYGFCLNHTYSYTFAGSAGFARMQELMAQFHAEWDGFGETKEERLFCGFPVAAVQNFMAENVPGMAPGTPKSNMLRIELADGNSVIIRPSGTEPKLKAYVTVFAPDEAEALAERDALGRALAEIMK